MIVHLHQADTPYGMIHDLRSFLDGWEFEPGKISVRKIIGRDGKEKIQTRIDLGLLQIHVSGRPDGDRPYGCESLLEYHEARLRTHIGKHGDDQTFELNPEECRALRHEGYLFYQRYLSMFVLEDFEQVEQDTARNLRLIDFCARYAENELDRRALEPQRAYTLMMNTRARAYQAMQKGQHRAALTAVDSGMEHIQKIAACQASEDTEGEELLMPQEDCDTELEILQELRREVLKQMPPDAPPRLEWELRAAIEREDYELAAELRDRLQARQGRRSPH